MKRPQIIFLHSIANDTRFLVILVVVSTIMLMIAGVVHFGENNKPLPVDKKVSRIGGDCYLSKSIPTTREEASVVDEKGWQKMVLDERISIAGMVSRGEATWLYIPATHICGQPAGEMETFGTWYWRRK